MEMISSKDNNKIKYIRSLNSRKIRDKQGAFIVEGLKFVKEAINENMSLKFIMISDASINKKENNELLYLLKDKNIEYFFCEDKIFNSVTDTVNSQGILAVVNQIKYNKEKTINEYKFIIMCDRIQDPGNLGTIIRTADAFGPAAVIMNKGCVDVYNPKVVRATAGAMFRVPFIFNENDDEIIRHLKNEEFKIISTVVNSNISFDDVTKTKKICIIIGNEGQGIAQEILQSSDMNITINMTGRAESLNASIAAGICIYEIRKKLL